MVRSLAWRVLANSATFANGFSGVWAIIYTLWGNKVFAMALIFTGIGWDGLDGYAARRAGDGSNSVGRLADSASDAITFCLAPAVAIAADDFPTATWQPYNLLLLVTAAVVLALGITRLVYFTLKAHSLPHFLGSSTPQNALAVAFIVLLFDVPGYVSVNPVALIILILLLAPLMVLPIRYPKMRDPKVFRLFFIPMMVSGVVALSIPNFRPAIDSIPYYLAYIAALAGLAILLVFYLAAPLMVDGVAHDAKKIEG